MDNPRHQDEPDSRPSADIVIPVYNEAHSLPVCLERLLPFCRENLTDYRWRVVIADNGSIDGTPDVATQLSQQYEGEVGVVHLEQKGQRPGPQASVERERRRYPRLHGR